MAKLLFFAKHNPISVRHRTRYTDLAVPKKFAVLFIFYTSWDKLFCDADRLCMPLLEEVALVLQHLSFRRIM
jgi:hypothetical protein